MQTRAVRGRRVLAYLLDPIALFLLMAGVIGVGTAVGLAFENAALGIVCMTFFVLLPVGFAIIEAWTGMTLVKWMLSLRVVTDEGDELPIRRGVLRWALKNAWVLISVPAFFVEESAAEIVGAIAMLVWAVTTVGCIPGLVDEPTLHDWLAGTTVVRRGRTSASS